MSNDPFRDLFNREIPRNASPASTRATLDGLTPQFRRAKSRRRSRLGAVAAVAILGSTGGAAALGVGPGSVNHRPPTDFTGLASSSAVENLPELQDLAATPDVASKPDIIVESTSPDVAKDLSAPDEVVVGPDDSSSETAIVGSDSSNDSSKTSDSNDPSTDSSSDSNDSNDSSSDSNDSSKTSDSSDSSSSDSAVDDHGNSNDSSKTSDSSDSSSSDPAVDNPDNSGPSNEASAPVAGPLTQTVDEGTVTVMIDDEGHLELDGKIQPSTGIRFEADLSNHSEIKVKFFSLDTQVELSELKFKLVVGVDGDDDGITVKVEIPSN